MGVLDGDKASPPAGIHRKLHYGVAFRNCLVGYFTNSVYPAVKIYLWKRLSMDFKGSFTLSSSVWLTVTEQYPSTRDRLEKRQFSAIFGAFDA